MNKPLRPMRVSALGVAVVLPLLLAACGGGAGNDASAAPPTPARSLGLMQLTVNGIGTNALASHAELLHPGQHANIAGLAADEPKGLDVEQVAASTVDVGTRGAGGVRYISVVYKVRNAQHCAKPGTCTAYGSASNNLSFVAANAAGNLNNTAVTAIYREDGSTDAAVQALATQMLPTDGMAPSYPAGNVILAGGQQSLQVFDETEITGSFVDPDATYLFPYGYVVENVNTANSRSLPASPTNNQWDGQLTFAFKVPLQATAADDPFSISFVFDVLDDTNTRVTESAEAQDADGDATFNALASSLGSTDLAVLGGHVASTNTGDPICTVRTAGPASAPTAYLANNSGPTAASAPSNLTLPPSATVNFGFCAPMDPATAVTSVVLNGSESGPHSGTVSPSGNVLGFVPAKAFMAGETVSYTLTTGLKSGGGAPLAQALVGGFNVGGLAPSTGTFALLGQTFTAGNAPDALAVGDFNGDGKLDVVSANNEGGNASVLLGNGDGTFGGAALYGAGTSPQSPAIGDFNGDGKLDIAVANGLGPITILLGNGDGTFIAGTPATAYGSSAGTYLMVVGDFNGDGKADIAATGNLGGSAFILLGNGDGTFAAPIHLIDGSNLLGIVAGDFNGDGKLDLAITDNDYNQVLVLIGHGDGSFAAPVIYTTGLNPYVLVAADFNGDGKLDLATTNTNDGTVSVLIGRGDGSFSVATYAVGPTPYYLVAGDFNGDGKPDLAVPDAFDNSFYLLPGLGDGSFGAPLPSTAVSAYGAAGGDLNGDGKLDLILAQGTLSVLLGK